MLSLSCRPRRSQYAIAALTLLLPTLSACSNATPTTLPPAPAVPADSRLRQQQLLYAFSRLDDNDDPDFNELTGINNLGKLVGFHGQGGKKDPNRGYFVTKPYYQYNFHN